MAYTRTELADFGTQISYLQRLRDFFVNNSVTPFEIITEPTSENLALTVERNNLNLAFTLRSSSYYTSLTVSTKTADGSYSTGTNYSSDISHCNNENTVLSINRALQILLIKSEESILLQIASYNATAPSKGITILDCTLNNSLNLIGSNKYNSTSSQTTIQLKESQTQSQYSIRPYHTGSNYDTKLILSNSLAVNNSAGVYSADVIGLKSAGGAKQFACYVTDSDSYYSVFDDVVITLGDKLEYTTEVSV